MAFVARCRGLLYTVGKETQAQLDTMPRFYTLAKGDQFKFPNDASDAVCTKTGPETYRVDRASDPLSVGLKCTTRADVEVLRVEVLAVCRCDYCRHLTMAKPRTCPA